jgi:hypothetical protein
MRPLCLSYPHDEEAWAGAHRRHLGMVGYWPGHQRRPDRDQEPIVKLAVRSAVESPPANTSMVVVSMTQSRAAAFQ